MFCILKGCQLKSSARKWSKQTTRSAFLNNATCTRFILRCTGVKACEFLHPNLQNRVYTSIQEVDWQEITLLQEQYQGSSLRRQANSWHYAIKAMFTKKTACRQHHVDSCAPTLQESRQAVSGGSYYYTACINWGLDSGHSSRAVPDTLYPQIRHLQNMFGDVDEREIKNEFCTVLKPLNSRQVHCGKILGIYSECVANIF